MVQKIFLTIIRFYQMALSPFFGTCCRFYPTCSEYAKQAIQKHGAVKGLWKALLRILRCHPLSSGGYDPLA